mmetsp:Transcript_10712/g.27065  ORF Transcript_10712/g.27065 Transcript_10712/m.27065 type:complete len:206 (+) Transcript_10712:1125-1742(+)
MPAGRGGATGNDVMGPVRVFSKTSAAAAAVDNTDRLRPTGAKEGSSKGGGGGGAGSDEPPGLSGKSCDCESGSTAAAGCERRRGSSDELAAVAARGSDNTCRGGCDSPTPARYSLLTSLARATRSACASASAVVGATDCRMLIPADSMRGGGCHATRGSTDGGCSAPILSCANTASVSASEPSTLISPCCAVATAASSPSSCSVP